MESKIDVFPNCNNLRLPSVVLSNHGTQIDLRTVRGHVLPRSSLSIIVAVEKVDNASVPFRLRDNVHITAGSCNPGLVSLAGCTANLSPTSSGVVSHSYCHTISDCVGVVSPSCNLRLVGSGVLHRSVPSGSEVIAPHDVRILAVSCVCNVNVGTRGGNYRSYPAVR